MHYSHINPGFHWNGVPVSVGDRLMSTAGQWRTIVGWTENGALWVRADGSDRDSRTDSEDLARAYKDYAPGDSAALLRLKEQRLIGIGGI